MLVTTKRNEAIVSGPLPHGRKSQNTPWPNLVCFMVSSQPDASPVVSIIEEPLGKFGSQHISPTS
jgi:hypothetical protein